MSASIAESLQALATIQAALSATAASDETFEAVFRRQYCAAMDARDAADAAAWDAADAAAKAAFVARAAADAAAAHREVWYAYVKMRAANEAAQPALRVASGSQQ